MKTIAVVIFAFTASPSFAQGQLLTQQPLTLEQSNARANFVAAVNKGDANAQATLGFLSEKVGDYAKADIWYRKAAEQGNAYAECELGLAEMFERTKTFPPESSFAAIAFEDCRQTRQHQPAAFTPTCDAINTA